MRVLRCGISMLAMIGCTTSGGGFPDARFLVDTTPGVLAPVDANRPRGPVVVGLDLTPADYSCSPLAGSEPASGDPMPVVVEVRDWSDQRPRAGVTVVAASDEPWSGLPGRLDCTGHPDCGTSISDASGHVTLSLRAGRVWLATGSSTDDALGRTVVSWITGRVVPSGADTLAVPTLGPTSFVALGAAVTIPGVIAAGRVRDCNDAPVHRVHVRAFDASNLERIASSTTNGVHYANENGNVVDDDRTSIDGVFVAAFDGFAPGRVRVEAWGLREIGGPEVLLGCVSVDFSSLANLTLVDIPPLASDAPTECGSVP